MGFGSFLGKALVGTVAVAGAAIYYTGKAVGTVIVNQLDDTNKARDRFRGLDERRLKDIIRNGSLAEKTAAASELKETYGYTQEDIRDIMHS